MQKKYELTNETIEYKGRILHRIKALISFDYIDADDLGGFVESEQNLSHWGNAWIYHDAKACDNATVSDNAKVYGEAIISGNAQLRGCPVISDYTEIYGHAIIEESAEISEHAKVYGCACIKGKANIEGHAEVYGHAITDGHTNIYESARVYGHARIHERSNVYGNATIYCNADMNDIDIYGNTKVSDWKIKRNKYRGKCYETHEWIYGYLRKDNDHNCTYIISETTNKPISVSPQTVSLYTGRKDKKGKRIYVGDILATKNRMIQIICTPENAQLDGTVIRFYQKPKDSNTKSINPKNWHRYQIIGNIFDNPELIEE